MSKIKPSIPKGTRDFLPEVMVRREFIFDTLRNAFRRFGFAPIETPAMENLDVLTGKYGEEGDRLIFRVLDGGDYLSGFQNDQEILDTKNAGLAGFTQKITSKALRYDLTVPFARAVVMNQNELTFPFKRYQIQPVWRGDRPQKGRYREFYQCDADVVGSDSLIYDAELVALFQKAFDDLGLPEITVLLNNRKILTGMAEAIGKPEMFSSICIAIDKLDKAGEEPVKEELVRRGLSADEVEALFEMLNIEGTDDEKLQTLNAKFSNSPEGQKGIAELQEVISYLGDLGVRPDTYRFDASLARGLDYYTGTIYEVKSKLVQIGSIASGGRYDDLTGVFGRPGLPGTGISFGADRIYDVLNELNRFKKVGAGVTKVMLANFGSASLSKCLKVLSELRSGGVNAVLYPTDAKMAKQFKYADAAKINWVLVIGEDEVANGKAKLKNMETGDQEEISFVDLLATIQNR